MLSVIFESLWVWFLAGVALWAFIGALVAASQRLPVGVGAAAGAVFWFVGALVVLIVGLARPREGGAGCAPVAYQPRADDPFRGVGANPFAAPGAPDPFASPRTHPAPQWGAAEPAAPGAVFGAPASPWGGSDDWGWPGLTPSAAPTPIPAGAGRSRAMLNSDVVRRRAVTALALGGALAMIVSALLPWGSGQVAWNRNHAHVSGGVAPVSAGPVALSIFVSAVVVAVGALLMHRRARTAWPTLAAIFTTWWFCLVLEWLLIESSATAVTGSADNLTGDSASVSLSTASGVWIMLVGCVAVYAWCSLASLPLLRTGTARPASRPATAYGL